MYINLDQTFMSSWDATIGTGSVTVTNGVLHCAGNLNSNYKRYFLHVDKEVRVKVEIYAKGNGTIQIADGSTKMQEVRVNCSDMQKHCLVLDFPITFTKKWVSLLLGVTSLIANGDVYFSNPIISIEKTTEGSPQVYAQGHISKTTTGAPTITAIVYNHGIESVAWDDVNKQIVVTLLRKGFAKEPHVRAFIGALGDYHLSTSRFDRTLGTFNIKFKDYVSNTYITPSATLPVDFYFEVKS